MHIISWTKRKKQGLHCGSYNFNHQTQDGPLCGCMMQCHCKFLYDPRILPQKARCPTSFDSLRATGLTGRSNWGGMGIGSRNASKISSRKCHNRWRLLTDNTTRSCLMSWSQRQQVSLPTWMPHWVSLPTVKGFLAEWIGPKTLRPVQQV